MLRFAVGVAILLAGCVQDLLPQTYQCTYNDPCAGGLGISIVCASDAEDARETSDDALSEKYGCAVKSYDCHVLEDEGACF